MKGNNKSGENYSKVKYTPLVVFHIIYAKYFWKFFDLLACRIDKFATLYEKYISKEYRREGNTFDTSDAKKIIHIGCGAYPVTAMTLAKENGSKIVAIDRSKRAVKFASQVISKRKLSKRITVKNGDGRTYPIEDFDTIIVSGCSIPKIEVLNHVFKTARPNSKIIVRELNDASQAVVDIIDAHKEISLIEKIGNNAFQSYDWESFFLIKK